MNICEELVTSLSGDGTKSRLAEACLGRALLAFHRSKRSEDALVDWLVSSLDGDLSRQLDAILRHERLVALQRIWRSTWFLVSRVDNSENIKCEILNCSKEDLLFDFEDAPEIPKSSLYKQTYSAEFGPFGGRPFAALLAHYEFSADPPDLRLLAMCGETVRHACMPFIAAASPSLCEASGSEAWQSFRTEGASRFTALVASDPLSIHGAYLLGVSMARSFAQTRLPSIPTGPVFGKIDALPSWPGASPVAAHRAEDGQGLVTLAEDPATGSTFVREARVCMSPAAPFAPQLTASDRVLNLELSSLLFLGRFVIYIKVLQREQIGTWKERETLQEELRAWLGQWIGPAPPPSDVAPPREPAEMTLLSTIEGTDDASEALAVYADWLEERARATESEFIRLQLALRVLGPEDPLAGRHKARLTELARDLDPSWRFVVGREGLLRLRGTHPLHQFELHITEVPENDGYWGLRLELEPDCSVTGRFARLVVENKLDRE